jgi:hypothetical protein
MVRGTNSRPSSQDDKRYSQPHLEMYQETPTNQICKSLMQEVPTPNAVRLLGALYSLPESATLSHIASAALEDTDSLWSTFYSKLKEPQETEQCISLFSKLLKLVEVSSVKAAEIEVSITSMNEAYLWKKLLPLCLWIHQKRRESKRNRIVIGIAGAPGAGS